MELLLLLAILVCPIVMGGMMVLMMRQMRRGPGLGRTPAAFSIDIDESGETVGLF